MANGSGRVCRHTVVDVFNRRESVMPSRRGPKNPLNHEPEAVTYAREQAGLTKTQLAAACGVALSLISEIESGTRNATPSMIRKLADALNCPPVVLERKRTQDTHPVTEFDGVDSR
ncbi:helix-turn-helix domain-containing protein [Actinomadura sp. SCN-SB]|uniref:helix-turn-helix domain-containing protein n=1 Tax=Actinomadura sp. SCN-SB TaxID=3373092 RepID=UPI003752C456